MNMKNYYICNCGRQFEKQSSLNSHARFCKKYVKKEKPISIYKLENGEYKCECERQFENYQSLNGHFNFCLIHRNGKLPVNRFKGKEGWCKGKTYEEYLGKEKANEYKNTLSTSLKKWHKEIGFSEETRNNFSKKQKLYLENNPHIKWLEIFNGEKNIKVQGKWEYNVAQWLNDQNIKWDRKTLHYDKTHRYTPDIYLIEFDEYLEVKGWLRECDKEKMNKVILEHNITIKMLNKKEYKNLNNLTVFDLENFAQLDK